MNEPVMVTFQTTLFTRDYNYRVVYVLTAFLQSTDLHFWSSSDCKQPSLRPLQPKKNYTTVYFPWILHPARDKFSKIVSKSFLRVFKGFKYYVFKTSCFWRISSFFSLSSLLIIPRVSSMFSRIPGSCSGSVGRIPGSCLNTFCRIPWSLLGALGNAEENQK